MKNKSFCAFILSHGRANKNFTWTTLKKSGYTGQIFVVIDTEDETAQEYYDNFGKENVIMFDKREVAKTFDEADNFDNRKTIVYARNVCFSLAKERGIKNFIQLDDDYDWFGHRGVDGATTIRDIDTIFDYFTDFLNESPISTVCFSQGGDHIGGFDPVAKVKRKAMNSFFCSTEKPFQFKGRINEDVTTYVQQGGLGKVFLTINNIQLNQKETQSNSGGMTDIYLIGGTYIKSFYSVIVNPSCVKVKTISSKNTRIHHAIDWNAAVACIIDEKYKKI